MENIKIQNQFDVIAFRKVRNNNKIRRVEITNNDSYTFAEYAITKQNAIDIINYLQEWVNNEICEDCGRQKRIDSKYCDKCNAFNSI